MADSLITAAVRALIGAETAPERNRFAISAEMVYDLADATEDPNPLYTDDEAAAASRFGGLLCPPLATWKDIAPPIGYFGAGQESHFEVPLPFNSYGLNGGSDWQFLCPPYVGDWITRQFRILDIYQKPGRSGPLVFVERQETQTNQAGETILLARRLSIHRALAAGDDAAQSGATVADELQAVEISPPGPDETVPPPRPSERPQLYFDDVAEGMLLPPVVKGPLTTTHLVRWAAANGNYARIHWDLPFAQLRQGLPNVVVNGSLKNQYLGQLLVDFAGPRRLAAPFLRAAPGDGLPRRHANRRRRGHRPPRNRRRRPRRLRHHANQQPRPPDRRRHRHRSPPPPRRTAALGLDGGGIGLHRGLRVLDPGPRFCRICRAAPLPPRPAETTGKPSPQPAQRGGGEIAGW